MQNHLKDQTSPYLLQHAENPVDWYPWCPEAFERAKSEDKPVFLSIGYSTCHWCHVMAHESFEDREIAEILNRYFISIKVDKEERPDLDSVYMSVCQAFTGSGGWPMSIFLTPEQKPFFAGTYFPKTGRYGQAGFKELLLAIQENWSSERDKLIKSAEEMVSFLGTEVYREGDANFYLLNAGFDSYKGLFDKEYGGFGEAPKFPTPHNLLFLMRYYEKAGVTEALEMTEKTLLQMYRGGIFDHIGGGFSRYSTDRYFLVPHFEKMLYDNALLILAYCKVFQLTGKDVYKEVAQKTADYILREMTALEGGFFSAQDADSEGVEGKYYLFEPFEIFQILGDEAGKEFNLHFDITEKGNFEGKSIPNLLQNENLDKDMNAHLLAVYEYRKNRYFLHLDDKVLTSWNGLMIASLCSLYRVTRKEAYLTAAVGAWEFIWHNLREGDTLYTSYRNEQRSQKGFLDDYANTIFALLALYGATLEKEYLEDAQKLCEKAVTDFYDEKQGGFFLYGKENEQLILRPKETYDGAIFSGNSVMAYNLVWLYYLTETKRWEELAKRQLVFMSGAAGHYPAGYGMFLLALLDDLDPPDRITVVMKDRKELAELPCKIPLDTVIRVVENFAAEYPLINDRTTFYVCRGRTCLPPTNELEEGGKGE